MHVRFQGQLVYSDMGLGNVAVARVRFEERNPLLRCETRKLAMAVVGQNSHCQSADKFVRFASEHRTMLNDVGSSTQHASE